MDETEIKPTASLEPGKTYVIKLTKRASDQDLERIAGHLKGIAPECKFLILPNDIELLNAVPVEASDTQVPR